MNDPSTLFETLLDLPETLTEYDIAKLTGARVETILRASDLVISAYGLIAKDYRHPTKAAKWRFPKDTALTVIAAVSPDFLTILFNEFSQNIVYLDDAGDMLEEYHTTLH
jgi:hypothetical protein